ncbi:MAG: hypothetical protein WEF86_02800 [Gemmatimonadota bacterium]
MSDRNEVRTQDERGLLAAMEDELRLLGALRATLGRMGEAARRADSDGIDDAIYASHRLMHTLAEAQRRRAALVEIGELRGGWSGRGAAIRAAMSRLLECGLAMDTEIRGRCAALERCITRPESA